MITPLPWPAHDDHMSKLNNFSVFFPQKAGSYWFRLTTPCDPVVTTQSCQLCFGSSAHGAGSALAAAEFEFSRQMGRARRSPLFFM